MKFRYIGKLKSIDDLKIPDLQLKDDKRNNYNIALIDNEDFPLMELLKGHGFVIDKFEDISSVKQLEAYNIILCDIKGVGLHFNQTYQGAYLIKEIYKAYPFKIIMAYTGSNYDSRYNEYLKFAEYNIQKDEESETWVEKLDDAIKQLSKIEYRWIRIRDSLIKKNVSLLNLALLEDDFVRRVIEKKSLEDFPSRRISKSFSREDVAILTSFIKTITKILLV